MLENREGQRVPDVKLRVRENGEWAEVSTGAFFAGRTVVVFALPGAFTPTCSTSHVPRYDELYQTFRASGVDELVCVSVNDPFVMEAWERDQGTTHVRYLADGNGAFTAGMGMLVDKSGLNFGQRSWRYSLLVRDGVIEKMFIEPDVAGDPFEVSDADTMLRYVAPEQRPEPDILLLTRPFCGHCTRAKKALADAGLPYEELPSTPRSLRAVSETPTTPRVFINGRQIGGADELIAWLGESGYAR